MNSVIYNIDNEGNVKEITNEIQLKEPKRPRDRKKTYYIKDEIKPIEKKKDDGLSYYMRNKAKMAKLEICDVCGGSYSMTSKSHHRLTKKHKYWVERNSNEEKKLNDIIDIERKQLQQILDVMIKE